ncbi:MAG: tetratricopeptide repeat protein [Candidatus Omnitrophica bacterium]|nr:tetratricopeptide repeat protein [Candidatus Omnitrophota bacterium]
MRKHSTVKKVKIIAISLCLFAMSTLAMAQDTHLHVGGASEGANKISKENPKELIFNAWNSLSKKEYSDALKWTDECIAKFGEEAARQQISLSSFPPPQVESPYDILNCVGVAYFIQGKVFLAQGDEEKAKEKFLAVINQFGFSQWWDPKGWFWKVAEEAEREIQSTVNSLQSTEKTVPRCPLPAARELILAFPGEEFPVDYEKYGCFLNRGTDKYRYEIKDKEGLSKAVGEGIYPNNSVFFDPTFEKLEKEGKLKGSQWDFINSDDFVANFYKWASIGEEPGVRLFYTAMALEKAGLFKEAIKAYYAIVVHFPQSIAWTYWQTPWYPGKVAIYKIRYLCRQHPELNVELKGARIKIIGGFDNDINNDIFVIEPGSLKVASYQFPATSRKQEDRKIIKSIGGKQVRLIQFANKDWQLLVDGKPYFIQGMNYSPTRIGQSPDEGSLKNWMEEDEDKNGLADGPYDAWVDKNRNNKKDEDEKAVGDFQLMQEMGVNTIRIYHHPYSVDKKLLMDLYENYGIMTIMGDFLGAYTIGSGANWYKGTNYSNPDEQRKMLESVKKMVEEFKDEPYILFWLLGNENNYGIANNAKENPEAFYRFVNQAAELIHQLDPGHPVAICNGDTLFLDIFARECPAVDIFGCNTYRGNYGFGGLWEDVKDFDKPVFISEYGCPAYIKGKSREIAEEKQAEYHQGCWEDIRNNAAFSEGAGNSLGGIVFEWLDEWWKSYNPDAHNTNRNFAGPFPDGWMYEEWLGICSQGDGTKSPYLRQLRKVYKVYQDMWRR